MSIRLTPDGARYLRMASGAAEPMPFHLRWSLPTALGESPLLWLLVTYASVGISAALIWALALDAGATVEQAALAAGLWLGLPSIRFLLQAPVLVDAFGMMCALLSALFLAMDLPWTAVAAAMIGATAWEKCPIFAALFAWSPWPLVGLIAPVARALLAKPGTMQPNDPHRPSLEHPLATGLLAHAGQWRDPLVMLAPWGACVVILMEPTLPVLAALAVAYSQLLLATDTTRLYQHAAPVVCIAAAFLIPMEYALVVLAAHWCNPFAGNGV